MNNKEKAIVFKALCDEKRLTILDLLQKEEMCACVLIDELKIGQSSLSYHMKILCESGLVESTESGKWTYYRINPSGIKQAISILTEIKI